jgi:hypothetical protein
MADGLLFYSTDNNKRYLKVSSNITKKSNFQILVSKWITTRRELAKTTKNMNTALDEYRQTQGKETQNYHYSNEATLCNKILNCQLKGKVDVDREMLNLDQLRRLLDIQDLNMELLQNGTTYQERKELLNDIFCVGNDDE